MLVLRRSDLRSLLAAFLRAASKKRKQFIGLRRQTRVFSSAVTVHNGWLVVAGRMLPRHGASSARLESYRAPLAGLWRL
jgi:hypothetical protein